jgi:hypothetical protein
MYALSRECYDREPAGVGTRSQEKGSGAPGGTPGVACMPRGLVFAASQACCGGAVRRCGCPTDKCGAAEAAA